MPAHLVFERGAMKKVAAIVLAGLAVCGCSWEPEVGGTFRIVSYNIRHGQSMEGKLDIEGVGRRIRGLAPRFAGIQEVDMRTTRVHGADTCAILARATGLHATFAKAMAFRGGEYGNVLLSREVPLSVRRIPLPGAEPRVLLLCEFADCWAGTMHLAADSDRSRIESCGPVAEAVRACGDKPVFLTGDWNASPGSAALTELRKFLTVISDERGATFHRGKDTQAKDLSDLKRCIDYIAVDAAHRAAYDVLDAHTVPDYVGSDHMPIVVEVRESVAPAMK